MNDEKMQWFLGVLYGAVIGMYGLFIKHVYKHVDSEKVQYKDNCKEIVKRLDQNHQEVCQKIDKLGDRLDKLFNKQ